MNKTIATHIAILATALLAFSKPACALSMTQIENDASSKIDFLLDWTPTPAPNSGTGIGGGPGQALVMAFEDQDSIMLAVYDATFLNPSPYSQ